MLFWQNNCQRNRLRMKRFENHFSFDLLSNIILCNFYICIESRLNFFQQKVSKIYACHLQTDRKPFRAFVFFVFFFFDREKVDPPLALHILLFTGCSLKTKQKNLHTSIYVYKHIPCREGREERVPTPQAQILRGPKKVH